MRTRRQAAKQSAALAGLLALNGLLPPLALAFDQKAFDAKSVSETLKALGAGALSESRDVTITAPDIAENGAVVPISMATTLAGVKSMLLMVEKNPTTLAAIFHMTDAIDAAFSARIKMGQSSDVYAVALMNDGKVLFAKKEVKVTLGGCGG